MKLVLIDNKIESETILINSFKSDCIVKNIKNYQNSMQLISEIENIEEITHFAMVYFFEGSYEIPYFKESGESSYKYFNVEIMNLITLFKGYNPEIKIDIITCNMNDPELIQTVDKLEEDFEIDIRFNLNNWILQSDNANIKDEYFNSQIENWTKMLLVNNLVIIKSSVSDLNLFKSSLNGNSKFIIYNDNTLESEILDEINSNITNVAFVWHFPGYYSMPFFDDGVDVNYMPIIQNQPYMSNRFYQLIQDIKTKIGQSYKLDFLSCDLRENDFINAMNNYENLLGINIRFSIDRTGNAGGNWILESDGANIKDQYFTNNINNWNHVLATGYTGSAVTSNISSDIVYNAGLYTLQNNITIDNDAYYIEISGNEVFDGQGYKITVTSNAIAGLFAFINADSSANMGTVKNLSVEINSGSALTSSGGLIVRQLQRYFRIVNCDSSGTISGTFSGGICGQNAASSNGSTTNGYFEIERCFSTGTISASSGGGITGLYARNGLIKKCYSTGNISGANSGGICGNAAGYFGVIDVIDCYASGIIDSNNGQGGICGAAPGQSGRANIYNCYYTTSPGGGTSLIGAIAGRYPAFGGLCYVYQSFHNTSLNMFGPEGTGTLYYNDTIVSYTYKSDYVGEIDYPNLDPSFTPLSSWVFATTSSGDLPVLTTTLNNANVSTILSNMDSYITPNSSYITNFKTFFQENSYNLDLSSQIYTTTLGDISGFTTTISSQPDISNGTVVKILSEEKNGTYTMDNSLITSLKNGQLFYLPGFNGETITLVIGASSYVITFGNSGFTYNATSYGLDSEFSLGTDIGFKVRFLGSGGLLGGEPTGGGGIGDPFIKPIFGQSYYLPNDESTYLLFDNKDNLKLYTKTWFAPNVAKMSFMRYLIFEFNNNRACFDLETFKWFKIDDQAKYLSHNLDVELGDLLFGKLKITNKNKKPIRDYYGKRFAPSINNKVIEIEFFLEKQNIKLEIISDLKYKDIRNNVNFIINGSIDRETLTKYNGSFISEYNVRKVNNNVFFNKNIKLY
jgi:hypothetical protein